MPRATNLSNSSYATDGRNGAPRDPLVGKARLNIVVSVSAACLFVVLSGTSLDMQGLYFDEVHQATASFAYVGKMQLPFSNLTYRNIPIMNMDYSGAIKSGMYGMYMRLFHRPFGVVSWRSLGIIVVGVGLLLWGITLRRTMTPVNLTSFYLLMVTDSSVLLTTRHDWGPTAIALSLRLLMIAVWLRDSLSMKASARGTWVVFALLGLSLFEKLSSVVLVLPFTLLVFLDPRRRNRHHVLASLCGGAVGASPLVMANVLSVLQSGELISLRFEARQAWRSFVSFLGEYLSLGAGQGVQGFILGSGTNAHDRVELILFASLLACIAFATAFRRADDLRGWAIRMLLFSYVLIAVQLYLLPQVTWVHHWIIGTPFQYTAMALLAGECVDKKLVVWRADLRRVVMALLVLLCVSRAIGVVSLERSLAGGSTSLRWDRSLTQFAEFASGKSGDAFFLVTDWGIDTQMTCLMNGEIGSILRANWPDYGNVDALLRLVKSGRKEEFYIVIPVDGLFLTAEGKQSILERASQALSPEWQPVSVDEEIARLRSLKVIKYRRAAGLAQQSWAISRVTTSAVDLAGRVLRL